MQKRYSIPLGVTLGAAAILPANAGELTVKVQLPEFTTGQYVRPYLAVWLEKADGTQIIIGNKVEDVDVEVDDQLHFITWGGGGWGDPMHMHRTIPLAETAGFQAIEIEDQILPKRAHHHIGIEHIIPGEEMAAKVKEAVAVRRSPDFLIIARTNAIRMYDLDDALRRAELYAKAGADILFVLTRKAEELRAIAERFDMPLMYMPPAGGMVASGLDRKSVV